MKITLGNVDSLIETDNPDLLRALSDKYAFPVKGYQFTPAYRRRGWDGKKRFITNGGQFKTGLYWMIREDLAKINCTPQVEVQVDGLRCIPSLELISIDGFTMRDYQVTACLEALNKKRGLIKSPTGSGKTLMIAGLVKALSSEPGVILFDEVGILEQTYRYLTEQCKLEDIGLCHGKGFIMGNTMLCTVQSIDRIFDSHLDQAKFLIVDEVHKFCKGDIVKAAIHSFPNAAYRFGFTATLPDDKVDLMTLLGAFGPVILTKSTQELIDEHKLAKPNIQIINFKPELTPEDMDLSYAEIYEKFIVNSEVRNGKVISLCEMIRSKGGKARICLLVKNLDHLNYLKSKIPNSYSLEGIDSIEDRKYAIKKFLKSEEPSFLIGTKVLQTGINIEEITHLINVRSLKDKIPTLQGLGRGMRIGEDKDSVMVYDFMDEVPYLEDHSKARIRHYRKEGHEVKYVTI